MNVRLLLLRNVLKVLEKDIDRIMESDDETVSSMSEAHVEMMLESASRLCPHKVSKYEAWNDILHISRATFDRRVADGVYPKGESHKGAKELFWDEAELLTAHQLFLKKTGASK